MARRGIQQRSDDKEALELEPSALASEQQMDHEATPSSWLYPLLFLSSIWVVLFLAAGVALTNLMSPSLSRQGNLPSNNAATVQVPLRRVEPTEPLPFWSFGAIALSCATGSMMISRQLNHAQQPRKTFKRPSTAPFLGD